MIQGIFYCPYNSFAGPLRSIEYPPVTFDQLVERVGVNKDLLDRPCSTEYLSRIAALLPNWLQYARALGLTEPQIQDIDGERMSNNAMKTVKMIKIWHLCNGFHATYRYLIDKCLELKHASVAENICRIVQGRYCFQSTHT